MKINAAISTLPEYRFPVYPGCLAYFRTKEGMQKLQNARVILLKSYLRPVCFASFPEIKLFHHLQIKLI